VTKAVKAPDQRSADVHTMTVLTKEQAIDLAREVKEPLLQVMAEEDINIIYFE
jgi:hypothetical protein